MMIAAFDLSFLSIGTILTGEMPNVLRLPIHSFDATYFHRIFPQKKDNGIRVQGVAAVAAHREKHNVYKKFKQRKLWGVSAVAVAAARCNATGCCCCCL